MRDPNFNGITIGGNIHITLLLAIWI